VLEIPRKGREKGFSGFAKKKALPKERPLENQSLPGSALFVFALLRGLDLDPDVLRDALDVLKNLASAGSCGFIATLELLKFFLEGGDFSFEGLDMAHRFSFLDDKTD
jgi:hypothetical protein